MKYLSLIISFLLTLTCSAQVKQYVFLLKDNGDRVHTKDSMDFIRVVKGPIEGTKLYDLAEYYPSGKPRTVGQSSGIDPVIREGAYTTYWPNGNIKATATYQHGKLTGDVSGFFRSGQLHTLTTYTQSDSTLKDTYAQWLTAYIKTCNDSTGKALLVDGNGYFIDYDDKSNIDEEGTVKNGKKTGEWKGGDAKEKMTYKEIYDNNGMLISGASIDSAGTYNYKERYIHAEYKGGINEFYKYLSKTIRYPAIARENNTRGKVLMSFWVTKKGKITDIKILQTVSPEIDKEAVRVVSLSADWEPGFAYGRAIKQLYTLPVTFNLFR